MNMYIGGNSAHMPAGYGTGAIRPTDITRAPSNVLTFVEEAGIDDPTICYASNNPTLRHMDSFCGAFADGSGGPVKVFDERRYPTPAEEDQAVNEWMWTHLDMWSPKEGIGPDGFRITPYPF